MKCIFCKEISTLSKSVEHIIPESIGNNTLILQAGIVCDKCNNYFSRKVEAPFLNSNSIISLRSYQSIANKRGRIPPAKGIIPPLGEVIIHRDLNFEGASIAVPPEIFQNIKNNKKGLLLVPLGGSPSPGPIVSRFVAKIALEYMAYRIQHRQELLESFIADSQLDPIRRHARLGEHKSWPVNVRRIYSPSSSIIDDNGKKLQVVHEEDFLFTKRNEVYFKLALFGEEFAINIGGPDIDGYIEWLSENQSESPLYSGKNRRSIIPKET